jgi:hypothetical protein
VNILNLFYKKTNFDKSPVLFLIFNRPETTEKVFAKIRDYRPAKLYVSADGPRAGNTTDFENCLKTKQIIQKIDWECEVSTLYRKENLGCRLAVSSAIDWVFEREETAIILEDDCLPNETFFDFCTCLLDRYRNDLSVHHISGNNFQKWHMRSDGSYYFSRYPHSWGWATWRRAWHAFDLEFHGDSSSERARVVKNTLTNSEEQNFWINWINSVAQGEGSIWDVPRCYSMWRAGGMAILPNQNLVSNIGFKQGGTHTTSSTWYSNMPSKPIRIIKHPTLQIVNSKADEFAYEQLFRKKI